MTPATKDALDALDLSDIEITAYEDMTREELIACCHAHDAHHKEHHEREEALARQDDELPPKPLNDAQTGSLNQQADTADAQERGALSTVTADEAQTSAIIKEARFLCDRLDEHDPDQWESGRDYYGHISPSHERLKTLLAATGRLK